MKPLPGTWLGALIGHLILIPLWTLSPIPMIAAIVMLFCSAPWPFYGLVLIAVFVAISIIPFPYTPACVRLFYNLDIRTYYKTCKLCGPHLGKMGHEKTLFMFHPHGVLATGFVVNGCWGAQFNKLTAKKDLDAPKNTGTVFLIARNLREWAPLFKVLCDLSGRLESATKSNIQRFMKKGRNLAIIPGGFEDATLHEYGKDRTMMSPRKGLIKYALQHGYKVTPIWSFGECETYHTFTPMLKQRLALNKYSIPGVLFFGWWLIPIFPRVDSEVLTYIGEPLQLPTIAEPTEGEIDLWHGKYVQALKDLYNAHKAEAMPGKPDAALEVW